MTSCWLTRAVTDLSGGRPCMPGIFVTVEVLPAQGALRALPATPADAVFGDFLSLPGKIRPIPCIVRIALCLACLGFGLWNPTAPEPRNIQSPEPGKSAGPGWGPSASRTPRNVLLQWVRCTDPGPSRCHMVSPLPGFRGVPILPETRTTQNPHLDS